MSRIRNIAIVVVAVVALSVSAAFAAPTVIKLAHPNVPQHPMGKAFEKFKELVETRSKGEFRVDIYDSSKFGNFDSVVQGLQYNMLQMGCDSTPNLAPFDLLGSFQTSRNLR